MGFIIKLTKIFMKSMYYLFIKSILYYIDDNKSVNILTKNIIIVLMTMLLRNYSFVIL